MRIITTLTLLLLNVQLLYAGFFDEVAKSNSKTERHMLARQVIFRAQESINGSNINAFTSELHELAERHSDPILAGLEKIAQVEVMLRQTPRPDTLIQQSLKQVLDIAVKHEDDMLLADYYHYTGLQYNRLEKKREGLEFLLKANSIIQRNGTCSSPSAGPYIYEVGVGYLQYQDYHNAKKLITQALTCEMYLMKNYMRAHNTLGVINRKLMLLEEANKEFALARSIAEQVQDSTWYGIISGNLGYNYYLQSKFEESIPLLETDFRLCLKSKEWASATHAGSTLAEVYLKYNKIDKAHQLFFSLDTIWSKFGYPHIKSSYYSAKAKLFKAKGDYKNALLFSDSAQHYYNADVEAKNALVAKQAEEKVKAEEYDANLQLLESEKKSQILLRNAIIICTILSLIIAVQLIVRQRQRHKQNQQNLQASKEQLQQYVDSLREKNMLIESFKQQIESLVEASQADKEEILARLQNFTILTDDHWNEFRQLFEKVHKDFFQNLKKRFPHLTQAEIRLIALSKLNLSKKEMAEMSVVSVDAIRKTSQRIRTKLELESEKELESLIASI
ncbi:hypothetical protein [Aridibaculum aurantiacum]|uniref:hypothetical protein n=1 Tax=Aridibaculum aurantiacum TaxID=2810307 RepID=UPI001A958C20|nr:hypothetical protein [Aridibaculum aurantiacum]